MRQAGIDYARVCAVIPESAYAMTWKQLSRSTADPNTIAKAVRHAEAACRRDPQDARFVRLLAFVRYKGGEPARAIKLLDADQSNHPAANAIRMMAHLALGDEGAARQVAKILHVDPRPVNSDLDAEIASLQVAMEGALKASLDRAKEAYINREWALAADTFLDALPLGTSNPAWIVPWGDSLAMLGRWGDSARIFQQGVGVNGQSWGVMFQCALVQLAAGDEAGYRATCAELIRFCGETSDPNQAFIITSACVVGDRAVEDMGKVVALARKATQSDPGNPGYWTALGAAQYRAGQTTEAIDTLKRAIPLHSFAALAAPAQLDQIQFSRLAGETFLAMAYQRQGDTAALEKQSAVVKSADIAT